jgi:outer membrane protein assembly factor BamD
MTSKRLLALLLLLLLSSCSSQKVAPNNSAEKFFREGESFFESRLYDDAIASWEKVRDTYYSPELNMLAELKIAEAYYQAERYEEAAAAYTDFLRQHPNNERAALVMYRLGQSYYQQMLSADRDQTSTENALTAFQQFLRRYPEDRNAEEVGYLVQRCLNRLAEHEVYVGRFYLRTKKYPAAIRRLERGLEKYPNYYYRDEAYLYLGQAYLKLGEKERAKEAFNKLFEQFPGSEYLIEAQKILAKEY